MNTQSIPIGMKEVQEIILLTGSHTMSIPASTGEQIDTIPHNLGFAPFVDYSVSFDGITYKDRGDYSTVDQNYSLKVYTDKSNTYFHFFVFSTTANALSVYITYKIYVVEATK